MLGRKVKDKKTEKSFENKKAGFNYHVLDTYEAGIVLNGLEIKAIRQGKVNLSNSYAKILGNEIFLLGANIAMLEGDPQRSRKLLLNESEIKKIIGKTSQENIQIIPLKMYFKRGRAKLLIGLGKSKKKYDKREELKKRDQSRENAYISKIK